KEEEEKEEGLRLLSEREKAQKEESNIRKTLKEREKEYKARKEARRIEEQKDNEERDRIIARKEARIAAENLETEEIYKLNEDSKQAFVKWQKAEEKFGSHSYSAKLIWDRECVVCLVVAPFT
uniref:Uncharacterized protein n=1 Tax=Pristionchus pacificus TaxID=54126 RepID=A0A2A6D0J6_PRIPA